MEEHPLLVLQAHDVHIEDLRKRMQALKLKLDQIEKEHHHREQVVEDAASALKELEVLVREKENLIETETGRKIAVESRLLQVTSVKQLDALKAQVAALQASVEKAESELLDLYERQEEASGVLDKARATLEEYDRRGAEERAEAGHEIQRIETEIAELNEKRPSLAEAVDRDLLDRYEKLRASTGGGRVVFDTDDMACPGCGMALPRQDFEKMKYRRDEFFDCDNCGRLVRYVGV